MSSYAPIARGAIVWALTLFENEAPFRVTAPSHLRGHFRTATALVQALGEGEVARLTVGAKARPVLLLQSRPLGRLPDLVALKLVRLSRLRSTVRARIEAQASPLFWFLGPDPTAYGLREQAAVDAAALVRVHPSALLGRPVTTIDDDAFAAVSERLARALELDLAGLVRREAAELLRRDLGF